MRPGSFLINASRGHVVDIDALAKSLREQHLGGAAIDVFPVEPGSNRDLFRSPLRGMDNVLLTPHIGGSTMEAQENIAVEVAGKLVKYSDNGTTRSAVNFPQVSLPDHENASRILHIHRNEPGVLQRINSVFSGRAVNIASQYLETHRDIGYVVMDIETRDPLSLLNELRDGGVKLVELTLHVGYGTFLPVRVADIRRHQMHAETFSISAPGAEAINAARANGKRVIAVGTTCVRTLEYASNSDGAVQAGSGNCDLFIYPGYRFKTVDAMITNFHLPQSTLLMLVSAFAGREHIMSAYREAIQRRYRFFSYGDAMFIY
jgi:D-3-phosphoglycerate dehydrogenase